MAVRRLSSNRESGQDGLPDRSLERDRDILPSPFFFRIPLISLQPVSAMIVFSSVSKMIKEDFKITREHGQWFTKDGRLMMALYHPAALLRDPNKKPETFEDLKRLQAKIREICVHTPLDF